MRMSRRTSVAAVLAATGVASAIALHTVATVGSPPTPDVSLRGRYPAAAIGLSAPVPDQRAVVRDYYRQWRSAFVRKGCGDSTYQVYSPDAAYPLVAEAQGYGMMITVAMSDEDPAAKEVFDGILRFVLAHPSVNDPGLMAAEQDENCIDVGGGDSASDGDMDIAYALLLAHEKWGSAGFDYRALAIERINAIKRRVVNPRSNLMLLGDWSEPTDGQLYDASRTSDWIVHHFRAFRSVTGDAAWDTIRLAHQAAIGEIQRVASPETGLLPDFVRVTDSGVLPVAGRILESEYDGSYSYNACRVPWRIGLDAITSGDPVSLAAARKINLWAKTVTGGDPSAFGTGYTLDGQKIGQGSSAAFWAPLAVAAMSDGNSQEWLDSLWSRMTRETVDPGNYFGATIQMQVMLILTGYYTPIPPT